VAPLPSRGFLRRQPSADAGGSRGYVSTCAQFGKGRETTFEDFVAAKLGKTAFFKGKKLLPKHLARSCIKAEPLGQNLEQKAKAGTWDGKL
jgi:hypothetical protein